MKTFVSMSVMMAGLLFSSPGWAKDYGAGVGAGEPVRISAIYENPAPYVGKTIVVEGTVLEVCRAKGCWMELTGDKPGQMLRIKVDDGVIVFPPGSLGKKAKVQGVLEEVTLDKTAAERQARYYALETGKPFDPAKIREGISYRIKATGAVIP